MLSADELHYLLKRVDILDQINFFKPIFVKSEMNENRFERLIISKLEYDCYSIESLEREKLVYVKKYKCIRNANNLLFMPRLKNLMLEGGFNQKLDLRDNTALTKLHLEGDFNQELDLRNNTALT